MSTRLSVIIPALNEAATLPGLLRALQAQTRPPDEVIVADANSADGTADLARALGAHVVPGGRPGPGRNAGARAATGDILLFLDADVLPGPDFIAHMLAEFERRGCVIATARLVPLGDSATHRLLMDVGYLYLQLTESFSPHVTGACILIRRAAHETLHGFDEAAAMAEDHDYAQRAAALGDFSIITSARLPLSMRRFQADGLFGLAFTYVWCEMHALAGKPIHSMPFAYTMGGTVPGAPAGGRPVMDVGLLRQQLGRFENPLQRMSASGLEQLERLASLDWLDGARARVQLQLEPRDSAILQRYLRRRLALIRRQAQPLRETFTRLGSQPVAESILLIERLGSAGRRTWAARQPKAPAAPEPPPQ